MSATFNRENEVRSPGAENDYLREVVHPLLGVHGLDS